MTRRPFVSLGLLLLLSTPLFADLLPGAPRPLDQPELRPWPTYSGVELTENDGVFLASWTRDEAVRLDRDGDGWIIPTRAYPDQTTSAVSPHATRRGR